MTLKQRILLVGIVLSVSNVGCSTSQRQQDEATPVSPVGADLAQVDAATETGLNPAQDTDSAMSATSMQADQVEETKSEKPEKNAKKKGKKKGKKRKA